MSTLDMQHPLVEQGPQEEALNFGNVIPLAPRQKMPGMKNYADDPKIVEFVLAEIFPLLEQTRMHRLGLEEEWGEIAAMNRMKHTGSRKYFGRSDAYFPIYKRERQKFVSALSSGLFPTADYFDVTTDDEAAYDEGTAHAIKHYMQWELERNAKFRSLVKPFLAQLADYGTSPLKYWYRKELVPQVKAKRPLPMLPIQAHVDNVSREGLAVSVRKLDYWYMWPPTAESLDDASMIFEDIDVPQSYIERMAKIGRFLNVDQVLGAGIVPRHTMIRNEMLLEHGITPLLSTGVTAHGSLMTLTEVWTFLVLPPAEYTDVEDPGTAIPARIVFANGLPIEIRRNPFYHQRPPYLVGRMNAEAGFFYGDGLGRMMRAYQAMINDMHNQVNDIGIMGMNPVTIYNPGLMAGPPRPFAPGVPWAVHDIDKAVRFDHPKIDGTNWGMQMLAQLTGQAQDMGGAPPDRATQSRGAKTATGMQLLQRNAIVPIQDTTLDIETDVMVPLLWGGHQNAMQFRDANVMATVAGRAMMITPDQLLAQADFRYLASSQAQNNQVRTQQVLQLVQAVLPVVPLLVQQGYVVDFVALFRRVYSDGFGFRGFDEFIKRAEVMNGQPGAPGPEQLGGAQMEQGDRMRSALEQLDGAGNVEAQPGEAEDFMEVRANADDLASMMGGSNNG